MTESKSLPFTVPELPMQTQTIRDYLPHRYPFLLVDRVTEVTENSITGYKNVSINEEFVATADKEKTVLKDGDVVEFLYFMGGGSYGA